MGIRRGIGNHNKKNPSTIIELKDSLFQKEFWIKESMN